MTAPQPQGWPPVVRAAVFFVDRYRFPLVAFGNLPT